MSKYYFHKPIFRYWLIAVIVSLAILSLLYGFEQHRYVECETMSDDDLVFHACSNPYYGDDCEEPVCTQQFISGGESLGEKPPWIVRNFVGLMIISLLVIFAINNNKYN